MDSTSRTSSPTNPYAVTVQAVDEPPCRESTPERGGKRHRWMRRLTTVINLGVIIAALFAWIEIETIIISGIAISMLAIGLLVVCRRQSWFSPVLLGWTILGFSLSCFLTIFLCDWSPAEAQQPVAGAITVYAGLVVVSTLSLQLRGPVSPEHVHQAP